VCYGYRDVVIPTQLLWGYLLSLRCSVTGAQYWPCSYGQRRKCVLYSVYFLLIIVFAEHRELRIIDHPILELNTMESMKPSLTSPKCS
jgi:hypothetical protein